MKYPRPSKNSIKMPLLDARSHHEITHGDTHAAKAPGEDQPIGMRGGKRWFFYRAGRFRAAAGITPRIVEAYSAAVACSTQSSRAAPPLPLEVMPRLNACLLSSYSRRTQGHQPTEPDSLVQAK